MPALIPTYYLALTAGNVAVLSFAWGRLATPLAGPQLTQQRTRIVQKAKAVAMKPATSPFPRGAHTLPMFDAAPM
ncbi:uncharacterized protein BP5553_01627 [Venustampulla echinocandica]|uniref:Uncharacterized protein n=1 Tax=Venustampulla echinocandica TaxID=2656787 RepID=A0A370U1K0_9HELO|nr:uncharacterized protein BP5553_01627 [Venustampulla echinocandica]RDL41648.1 hypothetical protein BP5553_01627 [Venustampulla echinocandica]